ncbi:YceD family protein [uncultured Lactobacillus sp.]|uniref:DUF177 domain-containing protein n=1 Tax=uncultured Lactobacillus sp. TaxID=153152 RepID=UPI002631D036|nr:YceD family protein [uncultured Lactobacillus sp.]
MLELSFSRIQNSKEPLTHIEREVEMRPEFFKRSKDLLIDAKNVKVIGDLFYQEPFVTGSFHVTADLVVPSSRSLKPVDYHEDFTFIENYLDRKPTKEELEENDTIVQVEDDQIDLQTAIEDNILLHIPTTILTPEEKEKNIFPEGQGWEVVSEASFEEGKKNQVNPAFAKLKVLLDNKDDNQDKK